ncbi:putative short-chain dehydrogenase/reductase family 42E member 2 [Kryptolebias marmoratus]|uniref:Short chain dehydrogenase/reductase family 42E, member 2 n=1 Tax=Kryptolebias marmoratus TaxID=37003 RepID=A0A3Q3B8J7_KRYMA|nr:putative short-chain dehydrogenase/reductase family 42E member 2 [Kryptolebias marmoratus]
MEVYSSNMSESGASVCQVKQLPCHSVPFLRLQAGAHHPQHLPSVTRKSLVNNSPPAGASSAVRHRGSTATAGTCSNPECAASRLVEEVAAGARGSSKGKVVVTGGAGYFGFTLGKELASEGLLVILMDLNRPPNEIPDGAVFYQSDIRDYSSLYKVCEGVDCIFHTASYGMSGPEQLRKELIESINIGGTSNIINVCKERGIPRLVYTSTINVVFDGKPIVNGDEASASYVPSGLHIDHYSRTKTVAEKMVLTANGSSLKDGGVLRTCALRPCGIYGPEERRHFDRTMKNVARGLLSFRCGDPEARMNWVHVDNLVLAHRLAAEALTQKRSCVASGQAYFINDGKAVNLFEWMAPVFEKLSQSQPSITLPISLIYSAAILVEYLHLILRPVIKVPLPFTRCEIRHISVTHTFKIDKARQELGYCPKSYNLADAFDHYFKTHVAPHSSSLSTSMSLTSQLLRYLILLLLMGLSLLLLVFSGIL